jgi:hypothetical protein
MSERTFVVTVEPAYGTGIAYAGDDPYEATQTLNEESDDDNDVFIEVWRDGTFMYTTRENPVSHDE